MPRHARSFVSPENGSAQDDAIRIKDGPAKAAPNVLYKLDADVLDFGCRRCFRSALAYAFVPAKETQRRFRANAVQIPI